MSLTNTVINRPTTFLILYALVVGMGLYIVGQLPVDLFPEISPPILIVSTTYTGAGPEEIEKTITRPIEGVLTNITNVKKVSSTSSKGSSLIRLELSWGKDLSEATNEIRDKLEFVKDILPSEARTPQIFKFDPSLIPIVQISIEGKRDANDLFAIAENQVQPRLEQINGVALVSISGGSEKAIRVEISQNRLEAYSLTILQVTAALSSQNIEIGSGDVSEGSLDYSVKTSGQFSSIEDVKNAVIAYRSSSNSGTPAGNSIPIRIRDIAKVTDSFKDPVTLSFVNGNPGIYISIQKRSGTNSVEVVDGILERLDNIRTTLPADVSLTVIYDTTTMIRNSLKSVTSSAFSGAILAMIVLFFFLRSMKSTLIIGLSIPISLLVTLMTMYFLGLTLNIMTLAGLTLGIGMIVDSSIVILENIYRYREKGAKSRTAALLGSKEMVTSITASILTTVGIFVPLLIFKNQLDIIGVLFKDLSLTIIVSLLASLAIAITLVPVLASKYLQLTTRKQNPIKNKLLSLIDSKMDNGFHRFDNGYKNLLGHVLNHRFLTGGIIVLILLLSFLTLEPLGGNTGIELSPQQGQDVVQIDMSLPVGTSLEITEKTINRIAEIAANELKGYRDIFVIAGGDGGFVGGSSSNRGVIWITLPPVNQQIQSYDEMVEIMRGHYSDFPEVDFSAASQNFMGGGSPIDIILRTENLGKARVMAQSILDLLKNDVEEIIEPEISLENGLPTANIIINRDKAYALGLDVQTVAREISAAVGGKTASRYRSDGDEYDIMVILQKQDRRTIPDLDRIMIPNKNGTLIRLSSIAMTNQTSGPVSIEREDRSRVVHVNAKLKPGTSLNKAEPAVRQAISEKIVPDDEIILEYSGDFAELMKYAVKFILVICLALALVYGIMASLFESLKDPFIIFISIFMIIPGVLFLYSLMNLFTISPLSMFSAVGMLMLIGISVNNGIVLVDYINRLRNRGLQLREAIIEAGGNRLRPILMTSLTTILGMMPLAFSRGEGSELVGPIGRTIIGGMLMSTLVSLFLIPLLYIWMNKKKERPA